MPCESCPCPDTCIARPAFCEWAKTGDPVLLRHIRDVSARSAEAPGPPPLAKQVRNAMGAVGRAVANVVTGRAVSVSDEEQARRLAICKACPEYDAELEKCKICGCYARFKARLASEHCPLPIPKW